MGEIAVSGPMVVLGYWNAPQKSAHAHPRQTAPNRRHRDDRRTWLAVRRRPKEDLINAGGYKVWPRDVEDVLFMHPAVRGAAVVGFPDEYRGDTVKAFVSLAPGRTATEAEIIAFRKVNLAAYKYPRSVQIVDDLPKNVSGKILRRELRLAPDGASR